MTVKELFDHFDFIPDKIVYFDIVEKTNGTVVVSSKEQEYDATKYYKFLENYAKRAVKSWEYTASCAMYLMIGDYENG